MPPGCAMSMAAWASSTACAFLRSRREMALNSRRPALLVVIAAGARQHND